MLQHAREKGHHFRRQDVTVLDHEQDWVRRGIKEALYIKALSPAINIDPGRHTLSTHFDAILKELVVKPPAPAAHNAETEIPINTAPRRQGRPRLNANPPNRLQDTPSQSQPLQSEQHNMRRSQRISNLNREQPA